MKLDTNLRYFHEKYDTILASHDDKPLKQLGLLSRQADIRRVTGASSVNLRQAVERRPRNYRSQGKLLAPSLPLLKEQPADYYRITAARYRKLLAETTTPRLTRYLGEMIARCERLAREIEGAF